MNATKQHPFTKAGLGETPFRFVGVVRMSQADAMMKADSGSVFVPELAGRPGSSCDYCGNAIKYEYWIRSADGKNSKVGCDCVFKTHDSESKFSKTVRVEKKKLERQLQSEKRATERAKTRARWEAERKANLRAWVRNPENAETRRLLRLKHATVKSMRVFLVKRPDLGMTEKQVAYLRSIERRMNEKRTDAPEFLFEGRHEVIGEIVSVKPYEGAMGETTWKMTVKLEDAQNGGTFLTWGTLPSAIRDAKTGDRVGFKARFKPSDKDSGFCFFKRPTGALILNSKWVVQTDNGYYLHEPTRSTGALGGCARVACERIEKAMTFDSQEEAQKVIKKEGELFAKRAKVVVFNGGES